MTTAAGPARKPRKTTGTAKRTTSVSKPRAPAAKSKVKANAGAKAKSGRREAKAIQAAKGTQGAARLSRDAGGWREETLARMRALILEAAPGVIEERKWAKATNPSGVPVWSQGGIVCTGETYRNVVKLTFARGAALPDPARLFNSSLEGNTRRAIDIHEGEQIDARAFKALVKAAVALNAASGKKR